MAQQVLNVGDGSTSTQQASGKCLSQIVRGNDFNASYPKCSAPDSPEDESVVAAVW
jgi:hypothetical protein